MSDYLPEEILIGILLKLPVKSLIRFTSVCKQWRCLIRSPSFISTHLSNSENQTLVRRYDKKDNREHYAVIPKRGNFVFNSDSTEFEFPFKCPTEYFRTFGSCDGLVCLSYYDESSKPNWQRIIIWNPAIRNQVVLPKIKPVNTYLDMLGFGVANNVYKVVRFVNSPDPNGNEFVVSPQAEVFCLGGTGRWRKLSGFDLRVEAMDFSSVFFKGFVHWTGFELGENSFRSSILTFNVGDEVFDETIILPEELQKAAITSVVLAVMGESLGAIKYDAEVRAPIRCDIWMMKDYGVKESWTKLYRIDTVRFVRVVGFRGSGEALLAVHNDELVTYDPETKGIKHVGVFGNMHAFHVDDDYKESLVLLGGYSGDPGGTKTIGWTGKTCNIL